MISISGYEFQQIYSWFMVLSQTTLTMGITIRMCAAAVQMNDYLRSASCEHVGRIEINPTQGKLLLYPSFRDITFYPIISRIAVLDEIDLVTKMILFTLCSQF
jgi:hypothetical protein